MKAVLMKRVSAGLLIASMCQAVFVAACSESVKRLDDRDSADQTVQKALAKTKEGDVDGAVQLYAEALNRAPTMGKAHLNVAFLFHDYKKDYVRAIYHYERYLELRPETEKKELIENRIRQAKLSLVAAIAPRQRIDAGRVASLEKENEALRSRGSPVRRDAEEGTPGRKPAAGGTAGTGATPAPAVEPQKTGQVRKTIEYRVKSGDTLSSIAAGMCGDPRAWKRIRDENVDALHGSDELRPGQVLKISIPLTQANSMRRN